jgi:adenosylmethionine-8-amino-7-oxononanoate aminotransferase
MCAVEFVKDKSTKAEFGSEDQVGSQLNREAQKRGLFTRLRGEVFCLAPPFVTTRDQLDRIVQILRESVQSVLG